MKKLAVLFRATVSFCASVFAAENPSDAELSRIIERARAVVGSEAAIDALKTLTFEVDVLDKDGNVTAQLSLQYKKPFFCREVIRRTETQEPDDFYYPEERASLPPPKKFEVETTTLSDGFTGVRIVRNLTEKQRKTSYLSSEEVLKRRDLVDANLNICRRLDAARGKTVFAGTQIVDGEKQNLVSYEYAGGLKLLRAFDAESGALVSTTIDDEIVYDVGEKVVAGGLTFLDGAKICDTDGNVKNIFRFTKISVNDEIPDSAFRLSIQEFLADE